MTIAAPATSDLLSPAAVARRRAMVRESSRKTLQRRRLLGNAMQSACYIALVIVLIPLVALISYTISRGSKGISIAFFTQNPVPQGVPGGGIYNGIIGTLIIVGIATVIAIPTGLAVSLFLIERKGRIAATIRFIADVMSGIPSIAIGVFAYALIVVPSHSYSGWSASFALAVLMLPIMVRADESAMRAVPEDLWDAALALGAKPSRVARSVVIRNALPGLVTGNLLALARAIGETAPLLFTALGSTLLETNPLHPMAAVPLDIYMDGTQADPVMQTTAWAAALLLLTAVLLLSIGSRLFASYMTRHAR